MKLAKYFVLAFSMCAANAMAFSMPSAPGQVNSTYDEIRTTDGATCRSANGGNLIFHGGVSSATGSNESYYSYNDSSYKNDDETGVYLGFALSYGGGKKIDCSRLAEIEFEKAELELKKLKAQVKALSELQRLNDLQTSGVLPALD